MEITLTRNTARKGSLLIYNIEGRPGAVQFTSKTLFNAEPPATLKITGDFAAPPVKLTAAERKLLPKPTPAEKLAKMEARIAKMKAQLAPPPNAAAPTAEQPAAPTEQPAAPAPTNAPPREQTNTRSAKGRK